MQSMLQYEKENATHWYAVCRYESTIMLPFVFPLTFTFRIFCLQLTEVVPHGNSLAQCSHSLVHSVTLCVYVHFL